MAIQDVLRAWANGRAIGSAPNDVKPPAWTKLIRNAGSANVGIPPLPEEEMIRVDVAISDLKWRKPSHHKAILVYYLYRKADKDIASELGKSVSKAREIRISAEHYLEARLEKPIEQNIF